MNQRDRLWIQREWIAWANWVRDGRTFPNALGYKSKTVEYALMRGETGGDVKGTSRVPTRFKDDRNVHLLDRVFWQLDAQPKYAIQLVYVRRKSERDVAICLDTSRHKVRQWLTAAYKAGIQAVTTTDSPARIASG